MSATSFCCCVGTGTALSQTEGFPQGAEADKALGVAPLAPTANPDKAQGHEHSWEPLHVPCLPRETQEQTGRAGCSLCHTGLLLWNNHLCTTDTRAELRDPWVSTGDCSP